MPSDITGDTKVGHVTLGFDGSCVKLRKATLMIFVTAICQDWFIISCYNQ